LSSRRSARRLAFELLFQWDVGGQPLEELLTAESEGKRPEAGQLDQAKQFVTELATHVGKLDALLKRLLVNWDFDRLANTDKNVLRLAAFEMLYKTDIPLVVSLSEAVDLSREYGDEKSASFVNGLLGALKDEITSGKLYVEGKSNARDTD
jgi:N utilization substance protein B